MLVQACPSQLFLLAMMSRGLPKEPRACCCCRAAVLYLVSGSAGERFPLSCVLLAVPSSSANAEQSHRGRVSNEHVRSLQRASPSLLALGLAWRAKGTLSLFCIIINFRHCSAPGHWVKNPLKCCTKGKTKPFLWRLQVLQQKNNWIV